MENENLVEKDKEIFTREEFEKDFFKAQNSDISIDNVNFDDKDTEAIRTSVSNLDSVKEFFDDAENLLNE